MTIINKSDGEDNHEPRVDTTCFEGDPDLSNSSPLSMVCHRLRKNWKVIGLGQCLSFLLASGGAAQATLHLNCGLSAPTFTMSLVYLGLSIIYLPVLFWRKKGRSLFGPCRKREVERLSSQDSDAIPQGEERVQSSNEAAADASEKTLFWPLRWYILLAFFDVEANAITMLAFRYTTLTSVTLFDALAIPASMVISRCIVFRSSRRYRPLHYVGVIVCMVGVVLNVFQDYESDSKAADEEEYPHKMWGDLCAITGGILYGLNDVLTEATVSKAHGTTEYLGMLGACGFVISFFQSLVLEREDIRAFFRNNGGLGSNDSGTACSLQSAFLLLFAFVGVTMCSYVGASQFLILSEAAFFNLSLLTGDLWSVLFSVVAERIVPQPLFFLALAAVLSGVVVYEMAPSPALEKEQWEQNRERGNDDEPEQFEHHSNGKDGIMMTENHRYLSQGTKLELFNNDGTDFAGVELKNISIT